MRAGKEGFTGTKKLEFVAKRFFRSVAGEFSGLEFSGGKIDEGKADGIAVGVFCDGGKKIVFASVEDGDISGGAWSDDADDFERTSFLPGPGCSI